MLLVGGYIRTVARRTIRFGRTWSRGSRRHGSVGNVSYEVVDESSKGEVTKKKDVQATLWAYDQAKRDLRGRSAQSALLSICRDRTTWWRTYKEGKQDGDWDWRSGEKYSGHGGVLVNAHYDSVSTGYGATDDGIGVISVLQLISYFTNKGNQPEHGIVALLNGIEGEWALWRACLSPASHQPVPAHLSQPRRCRRWWQGHALPQHRCRG